MPERLANEQLHDAISTIMEPHVPEGSMLIGSVLVMEWMAPDSTRWLQQIAGGDPTGGRCPSWQSRGYMFEALYGKWPR